MRRGEAQTFHMNRAWARRRLLTFAELYVLSIPLLFLVVREATILVWLIILTQMALLTCAITFWTAQTVARYTLETDALVIDYGTRTRRIAFAEIDRAQLNLSGYAGMRLDLLVGKKWIKLPVNGCQHDALVRGIRARLGPGVMDPGLARFKGLPAKGFFVAPLDFDALAARIKEGRG